MDFIGIIRTFIALGIGLLLGAGMGYIFLPRIKEYADKKGAEKRKIVELLSVHKKVSVSEVGKYLGVSIATAEKYLVELERRGLVRRMKNTGENVLYEAAAQK